MRIIFHIWPVSSNETVLEILSFYFTCIIRTSAIRPLFLVLKNPVHYIQIFTVSATFYAGGSEISVVKLN